MASPTWTSKDDPTHVIEGAVIRANQGNWTQGQGGAPLNEPRYVFVWFVNGRLAQGELPPTRSDPAIRFAGEGVSTFDMTKLAPGAKIRCHIYAGSRFSAEWYEWGGGNVVTGEAYSFVVTVPAVQPDPTPGDVRLAMLALGDPVVALWTSQGKDAGKQRIGVAVEVLRADLTVWYSKPVQDALVVLRRALSP